MRKYAKSSGGEQYVIFLSVVYFSSCRPCLILIIYCVETPFNLSCFFAPSFYGGSEDLSDDITQQQLLPGVK